MKRSLNSLFALALLASLALASTQSLADDSHGSGNTVYVAENSTGSGQTANLVLPIQSGAHDYLLSSLNLTIGTTSSNGTSFQAFCIDPFQYSSHSALQYTAYSNLDTLGSTKAGYIANLYSQSYASTSGNDLNSAAFQLALWELAKDDGVLTTGAVQTTSHTSSALVNAANSMIYNAEHSGSGSTQYSFSLYTNGSQQDYLVASVSAVPEPATYAMLLAGLGLMGFTARRRQTSR